MPPGGMGWFTKNPKRRCEEIYEFHQEYVFIDTYLFSMFNHQICEFHQALGFFTGENGEISPFHPTFKGCKKWGISPTKRGLTQQREDNLPIKTKGILSQSRVFNNKMRIDLMVIKHGWRGKYPSLSLSLSISLHIYIYISKSIAIYLSTYLPIYLICIYIHAYLSLYLSIYSSAYLLPTYVCIYLCIYIYTYIYISSMSVYLWI